ncbi:MAG: hypothetical protein ACYDCL_18950 [Myxococcales bacterium]
MARLAAAAPLLALAACQLVGSSGRFPCRSSADCPPPQACAADGYCGGGDAGADSGEDAGTDGGVDGGVDAGPACAANGLTCSADTDCCSQACDAGRCACLPNGAVAASAALCCSGQGAIPPGSASLACCGGSGLSCTQAADCCTGYCASGSCGCAPNGAACQTSSQCCGQKCTGAAGNSTCH